MSYRSSPDGLGPQSELAVLPRPPNVPDAPRRARVSPVRSNRAASRPSLTPNGISPRRHHTHLALDGLPSFQRRGSPGYWRVDDAPCRPRRPNLSGRAHEQRQAILRPFSTARVTCVPAGPRRSGLQQCQPRVVCATERHETAARFRLSAHRCGPCGVRWSTFSLNRYKRNVAEHLALLKQLALTQSIEVTEPHRSPGKPKRCGKDVALRPAGDNNAL